MSPHTPLISTADHQPWAGQGLTFGFKKALSGLTSRLTHGGIPVSPAERRSCTTSAIACWSNSLNLLAPGPDLSFFTISRYLLFNWSNFAVQDSPNIIAAMQLITVLPMAPLFGSCWPSRTGHLHRPSCSVRFQQPCSLWDPFFLSSQNLGGSISTEKPIGWMLRGKSRRSSSSIPPLGGFSTSSAAATGSICELMLVCKASTREPHDLRAASFVLRKFTLECYATVAESLAVRRDELSPSSSHVNILLSSSSETILPALHSLMKGAKGATDDESHVRQTSIQGKPESCNIQRDPLFGYYPRRIQRRPSSQFLCLPVFQCTIR
jgi:hypothetical protein